MNNELNKNSIEEITEYYDSVYLKEKLPVNDYTNWLTTMEELGEFEFFQFIEINEKHYYKVLNIYREIRNANPKIPIVITQKIDINIFTELTKDSNGDEFQVDESITETLNSSQHFTYCLFNNGVEILDQRAVPEIEFIYCVILKNFEISGTIFKGSLHTSSCYVESLWIESCKFNETVSLGGNKFDLFLLSQITFVKNLYLVQNTFYETPSFSLITGSESNQIDIIKCKFPKALLLTVSSNSISYKFNEVEFFQNNNWPKNIKEIFTNEFSTLRAVFFLIKHSLEKEGNYIEAQVFRNLELEAFRADKTNNVRNRDRFSLWLNNVSSRHGTNYSRAFLFILIMAALSSCAFLIPFWFNPNIVFDSSPEVLWQIPGYFAQILNVTKWDVKPFGIENNYGYFILFTGRLAIGYGYYQFISAFRKYGKN